VSAPLAAALAAWAAGDHYEAHERLEELADALEDDDAAWRWALALCHIAAACHKQAHGVGPDAVPGKLRHALAALAGAPPDWLGLQLTAFVAETEALLAALEAGREPSLPRLR